MKQLLLAAFLSTAVNANTAVIFNDNSTTSSSTASIQVQTKDQCISLFRSVLLEVAMNRRQPWGYAQIDVRCFDNTGFNDYSNTCYVRRSMTGNFEKFECSIDMKL
jgi:hypothetical protein